MLNRLLSDRTGKPRQADFTWPDLPESESGASRVALRAIRSLIISQLGQQATIVYCGAGPDTTPTFIFPLVYQLKYVDVGYNPESPLAGCGNDTFDSLPNITCIAADLGDLEAIPVTIDALYTTPFSPSVSVFHLERLRIGGLFVCAYGAPSFELSDGTLKPLEALGFRNIGMVRAPKDATWPYSVNDVPGIVSVYQKINDDDLRPVRDSLLTQQAIDWWKFWFRWNLMLSIGPKADMGKAHRLLLEKTTLCRSQADALNESKWKDHIKQVLTSTVQDPKGDHDSALHIKDKPGWTVSKLRVHQMIWAAILKNQGLWQE